MQTPAQRENAISMSSSNSSEIGNCNSIPASISPGDHPTTLFPTPSQLNALLVNGVIFSNETPISHSTYSTAGKASTGQVL